MKHIIEISINEDTTRYVKEMTRTGISQTEDIDCAGQFGLFRGYVAVSRLLNSGQYAEKRRVRNLED